MNLEATLRSRQDPEFSRWKSAGRLAEFQGQSGGARWFASGTNPGANRSPIRQQLVLEGLFNSCPALKGSRLPELLTNWLRGRTNLSTGEALSLLSANGHPNRSALTNCHWRGPAGRNPWRQLQKSAACALAARADSSQRQALPAQLAGLAAQGQLLRASCRSRKQGSLFQPCQT